MLNPISLAADTCSIILLEKSGALPAVAHRLTLAVPETVLQELAAHGVDHYQPYLRIVETPGMEIQNGSGKLSNTDRQIISLCQQGDCDAILSDDKQILLYADRNNLDYYSCLSLYALMYHKGLFELEEVMRFFNKTKSVGRYSQKVIDMALKMIRARH